MDTHLSFPEWISLSRQCGIQRGALTPLIFDRKTDSSAQLPPFWVDPGGKFTLQALPLLQLLADPRAVNGIAFLLPDFVVDGALVYPAPGGTTPGICLLNSGDGLQVQTPIPLQDLLATLRGQFLPGPEDFIPVTMALSPAEAWLLWALVDLSREQETPVPVALDDIIQAFNRPYDLLQNLAAWFREAVGLAQPSRKELEACLRRLQSQGWIKVGAAGGLQASGITHRLVEDFSDLNAFLMFKTSVQPGDGDDLFTMRNWIFQGGSGAGWLFFVNGQAAELTRLLPENILGLADRLLRDPFDFFPVGSKPARARRPAPPETL
jgi:hypothetical protein